MGKFWQKPAFRILVLVAVAVILIPLVFYFFKKPILSLLSVNLFDKPQSTKLIGPGKCLILEEKYCSQAKVINWTNPAGQKMKLIGLDLPEGTPLFMPIDGQVAKVKMPDDNVWKGVAAIILDLQDQTLEYHIVGDLKFENMFSLNKKKGEIIGWVQKTGIKNAGGYNVIFYILRGTGRETVVAEDELEKMFPVIK